MLFSMVKSPMFSVRLNKVDVFESMKLKYRTNTIDANYSKALFPNIPLSNM